MPSAVFSDEPTVEVSHGTLRGTTLTEGDIPLFEIILDSDPDVTVESSDTLLGVVGPASSAPIIELVTDAAEPVLDITLEDQAVVDISAVGVQGPEGAQGAPGPEGDPGPVGPPGPDWNEDIPSMKLIFENGLI